MGRFEEVAERMGARYARTRVGRGKKADVLVLERPGVDLLVTRVRRKGWSVEAHVATEVPSPTPERLVADQALNAALAEACGTPLSMDRIDQEGGVTRLMFGDVELDPTALPSVLDRVEVLVDPFDPPPRRCADCGADDAPWTFEETPFERRCAPCCDRRNALREVEIGGVPDWHDAGEASDVSAGVLGSIRGAVSDSTEATQSGRGRLLTLFVLAAGIGAAWWSGLGGESLGSIATTQGFRLVLFGVLLTMWITHPLRRRMNPARSEAEAESHTAQ